MKAYRIADGSIQLFRPYDNARRLNDSAERLCMPEVPVEDFVEAVKALVRLDQDWVPHAEGTSLYIRPFLFGNDETLGVHAVNHATFMIILSPVGSYYKEGLNPVSIMIEDQDVRAVRGGTGEAKCGGNYAASNRAGDRAEKKGYSQVLWLDGVERKYIEEVGAMNVMFKISGTVVTPALSGSILPGITRKSIIEMLKKEGYKIEERRLSVEELAQSMKDGTLEEAWGCGTAAVVSPIGELCYKDQVYIVNEGKIGELTQHLYDTLTGIQWGKTEDTYGWTVQL
jgi:branched-chain amino acid aminotransferase